MTIEELNADGCSRRQVAASCNTIRLLIEEPEQLESHAQVVTVVGNASRADEVGRRLANVGRQRLKVLHSLAHGEQNGGDLF